MFPRNELRLTLARDRPRHSDIADTGLLEHRKRSALPDAGEDVGLLGRKVCPPRIGLDLDDVLILFG